MPMISRPAAPMPMIRPAAPSPSAEQGQGCTSAGAGPRHPVPVPLGFKHRTSRLCVPQRPPQSDHTPACQPQGGGQEVPRLHSSAADGQSPPQHRDLLSSCVQFLASVHHTSRDRCGSSVRQTSVIKSVKPALLHWLQAVARILAATVITEGAESRRRKPAPPLAKAAAKDAVRELGSILMR